MSLKNINKDTFTHEVINSVIPVLVDFWAPWCGPCLAVGPVVEDIAKEHGEVLKVVKVNVDENPELSARYGIRSIPAFKVFNKGEVELAFGGAMPKSQFTAQLAAYLTK